MDDARGTGPGVALHLARAQVHATLALVEEARTANLLHSLDYGVSPVDLDPSVRRAEITARLWPTSPVPPVSDEDVETLAGLVDDAGVRAVANASSRLIARRLLATGKVTVRP